MSSKEIYLIWLWLSMFIPGSLQVNNFFRKPIELVIKKFVFRMKMLIWPLRLPKQAGTTNSTRLDSKKSLTFVESPQKLSQSGRYYVRLFYNFTSNREVKRNTFLKSSKSLTAITWRNKNWANEEKPQRCIRAMTKKKKTMRHEDGFVFILFFLVMQQN